MTITRSDWEQRFQSLNIESRAFIDGQYCAAASGATFECISPVDGRFLANVASTDEADANAAVAVARRTFESGVWANLAPAERKRVLIRFADLILANQEELALLETLDMGKPISDSMNVDIPATANAIRWTAEAIDKIYDEVAATPRDQLGLVTREPAGVVAAIVPWNFPLIMASWKFAPALAAGNSFILKPSEKSPLTAIRIAQLALEAGIPKGVFNVLPGYGHTVGKALALHMDVDVLAFTGSTAIAKQLMIYAGQSNMKRVWARSGGQESERGVCRRAGPARGSTSGSRRALPSTRAKSAPPVRACWWSVRSASSSFRCWWKPCKPGNRGMRLTRQPPSARSSISVNWTTCCATSRSAETRAPQLIAGGQRTLEETGGLYVEPAIFDGVTNAMTIAREEIFGPVLSLITFDTAEEALAIANDSIFGLAAGVWTSNLSKAHTFARGLRAGSVWVNQYDGGDMTAPFGGLQTVG